MSRLLAAVVISAAVLFVVPAPAAAIAATCGTTNIALNRPATASSSENGSLLPAKAFDGNSATRWSSAFSDPQRLQVDLGGAQQLCRVVLRWEAAYARTFTLQGSPDGASWFDLVPAATSTGGTQTLSIAAMAAARYVRLTGLTRATRYGYSLFEVEVYPAVVPPAASAAWPTWGGGAGHAGVNVGERTLGAANVGTLHRLRLTGADIEAPVVASGIAYGQANTLQFAATDLASGAVRWTTPPATEPALRYTTGGTVGNGLVYAGTQIGFIHAFDAMTGVERWNFRIDGNQLFNAPILVGDTLYAKGDAPGDNTLVYAFDAATGAVRWTRELTGYTTATVAYDSNRLYVAGGNVQTLTAVDATTGAVLWSVPASQSMLTPVAAWGRVYLGFNGLVAYDGATGRTLWTRPGTFGFPAVQDTTLYSVDLATPPVLHAIDPATGADRWTFTQAGPAQVDSVASSFPVVANGVLYVNLGQVLALNLASRAVLWTGPSGATAGPIVADGRVLIHTSEGLGVYGT
ncbi:PQQ-binding-like beta-propeller repeat protein [Dactylosporangium sp. CA-152071]|uniref:outer membrane protein assembly factor BamB family protein n=1 Tax=Dactylosporangium sp. CA-152071 TaxID=3239933 RepID=UPI003D8D2BE7